MLVNGILMIMNGRPWACIQAEGRVISIAMGDGMSSQQVPAHEPYANAVILPSSDDEDVPLRDNEPGQLRLRSHRIIHFHRKLI